MESDKERFLIRNCWKTDSFFNTLARVKPAPNTHEIMSTLSCHSVKQEFESNTYICMMYDGDVLLLHSEETSFFAIILLVALLLHKIRFPTVHMLVCGAKLS